jgi:fucose 4-O-acetylase-like acetyltransferase
MIHAILYALGSTVSYNPPLWFLPCIFVTELLFYGIAKKYYWKPGKLVFWLTAAAILGYLYSIYVPFRLLWSADVALSAVAFYGAGNLFKKLIESEKSSEITFGLESSSISGSQSLFRFKEVFSRVEKFLPSFFILISLLYFGYLLQFPTDKINMNVMKYGNFFSFYFLAFSGIFAFFHLFKNLGSSKILEYYGRNSLLVLGLHFPLKDVLTKLGITVFGVELECFFCKTAFALGLTVVNLLCLVPLIFLINNYLPFLLGKKGFPTPFKALNERLRKLVD